MATTHYDQNGVLLSIASKDCVDLYDKACLEIMGWRGDPISTIKQALERDPNFIMGHVINTGLDALSNTPISNPNLASNLQKMNNALSKTTTEREKKHVQAVNSWCSGNLLKAVDLWEDILVHDPTDILALKYVSDTYFYLGDSNNIRDSVARVHNEWQTKLSYSLHYGYVLGMYSFGLEETNFYREAEKIGRQAQERNPTDIWAVHAVTHVHEMEARAKEGIEWNEGTKSGWKDSLWLVPHLNWHTALYNMELERYDEVLRLFDQDIKKENPSILDLVDASSLLFRCHMFGVDVGDRWEHVYNQWATHITDHVLTFNDLHILMSALGSKKPEHVAQVMESIREYASINGTKTDVHQGPIAASIGLPIAESMVEFFNHNYHDARLKLTPIRHHIQKIGGSHAQRDLWNSMLIQASLAAKEYHPAHALLSERVMLKPKSIQTWKWYSTCLEGLGKQDQANAAWITYKNLLGK